MKKFIVSALTIIIFLFLIAPTSVHADTTCQDGKTSRISGAVWQSITYGNRKTSVGLKDAKVTITRGIAPNQTSVEVLTGGSYEYIGGKAVRTGNFSVADQGNYDLCKFVYDADIYKATGAKPNANTVFSVTVTPPAGYTPAKTVFTPMYTIPKGATIEATQDYVTKANTANGATAYVNQIANSNANPVPGVGGTVTTCLQYATVTAGGPAIKYRCDFISTKAVTVTPSPKPVYQPVGGTIKSNTGAAIGNVQVDIIDGLKGITKTVRTQSNGTFRIDNYIEKGHYYAVRPRISDIKNQGYTEKPGTTNNTRSYDTCKNSHTPAGSTNYECQRQGSYKAILDGCSSTTDAGVSILKCDFVYAKPATPPPTPAPVYEPVGGTVKSTTGIPLIGVQVEVYNQRTQVAQTATTIAPGGTFRVDNFIQKGDQYIVRPNTRAVVAQGYSNGPGTANNTRSYNTCTRANTPNGSDIYECQVQGSNSCSIVNSLACNFVYAKASTPSPSPIIKTASPKPSVTPSPSPTPTPPPVCEADPADVVLLLDQSSSIEKDLINTKAAAKAFVNGLSTTDGGKAGKIRIGVVSYNKIATKVNDMTTIVPGSTQINQLLAKIDGIQYVSGNNGTCMECGEKMANSLLSGSRAVTKSIILLSDGRANVTSSSGKSESIEERPYPEINKPMRDAVSTAVNSGYVYYAVGYGSAARTRGDVLSAITEDSVSIDSPNAACAYPPSPFKNESTCNYDYEPNSDEWTKTFAKIGGSICRAYEPAILEAAGIKVAEAPTTPTETRQMGFFEFAFQVVKDLVSGKYLDDVFADR